MHPDPAFRLTDRDRHEQLIETVGFGAIYGAVGGSPRVAHTPIISLGDGRIRFHLSKRNALAPGLADGPVLAVVTGPNAYISPRWYEAAGDVPTWNYIALEMAGPVRTLDESELEELLLQIGEKHEARISEGAPWNAAQVPTERWDSLFGGITGFEMAVDEWRPTFKLSQNKPAATRAQVADALARQGELEMAEAMRGVDG